MKSCVVLAAFAGIASGAVAEIASLSVVASNATIDTTVSTVLTLDIYADSSIGTVITQAAFTINGSGSDGMVTDMVASSVAWGSIGFEDLGHDGNGSSGMTMGQVFWLPFIQPNDESYLEEGPVYLGSFAVTFAPDIYGSYEWTLGGGIDAFVLEVFEIDPLPTPNPFGGHAKQISETDVDFGPISVNVIPSPAGIALLGLGGLFAGRRRR